MAKTDGRFSTSGALISFSDLSVSILGEASLLAALERVEVAAKPLVRQVQ
jgi:hypothetical protein